MKNNNGGRRRPPRPAQARAAQKCWPKIVQKFCSAHYEYYLWTEAVPWQREGYCSLSNTVYRTAFARRYRLTRPRCAQGPNTCKCGKKHSADLFRRHDGDHDEADCKSRIGIKQQAHIFWLTR